MVRDRPIYAPLPQPQPLSLFDAHNTSLWSHWRGLTRSRLALQRVRSTAHFPPPTTTRVISPEEPDEWIDEGDP